MELTERTKTYLSVLGISAVVIFIIVDMLKSPKFSCDDWANGFKKDFSCNIILTKKANDAGVTTLTGINIKTKTIDNCMDDSKWVGNNLDKFNIGDTIVKNKGEYTILIKRKNKSFRIFLKCGEKTYKD